jgi:hypothetical protein
VEQGKKSIRTTTSQKENDDRSWLMMEFHHTVTHQKTPFWSYGCHIVVGGWDWSVINDETLSFVTQHKTIMMTFARKDEVEEEEERKRKQSDISLP